MSNEEDRSYSDAMSEWATKQSVFQNTRSRLIHPDPSLPVPFRIFGYLFRLGVLALICYGLAILLVGRYLKGNGFAQMMAAKVADRLEASDYKGYQYSWKGNRGRTRIFSATGSDRAFYKQLYATAISFELPRSSMFSKVWTLEEISVGTLDMELRVGGRGNVARSLLPGRLPLTGAGFGINPDIDRLRFDAISIERANLRWGVSETNRGSLEDSVLGLAPIADGYALSVSGGTLTQNWWRDFAVESLQVEIAKGGIAFSDAELRIPGGGKASLDGNIEMGNIPKITMKMAMEKTAVSGLLHRDFHRYLAGTVDGVIDISGSPNTMSGVAASGTLTLSEGRIRNVATFKALASLLDSSRFHQFPLTSGTMEFSSGGGALNISSFEFLSDAGPQGTSILRGSIRVTLEAQDASEAGVPPLEIPPETIDDPATGTPAAAAVKENDRWVLKGNVQLGIPETALAAGHPAAAEFFKSDGKGRAWIELPLEGKVDELSRDFHNTVIERTRTDAN